jgi:phosphatidylserine/phosphatidylglycerophosphate/cardiolipin synthase-like enzyme
MRSRADKHMENTDSLILGDNDEVLELDSLEEHRQLTVHMLNQARHSIDIISRNLDPRIFDRPAITDAIKAMVSQQPRSQVRIIIRDNTALIKNGHHILLLAQRLTSFIHIHKLPQPYNAFNEALLLVDGTGYVRQRQSDIYAGNACFNAPRQVKDMTTTFQEIWDASQPDPECRRLSL